MTDPTPRPPLSPAAQAVLDACGVPLPDSPYALIARAFAAAALRAAADQVVPLAQETPWGSLIEPAAAELRIRAELLALAAELEGGA